MILQLPFDVVEAVVLESVESHNSAVANWFDLTLGKIVLVHVCCLTGDGEPQAWKLIWPGSDGYHVNDTKYADPVSAAHGFYLEHIRQAT